MVGLEEKFSKWSFSEGSKTIFRLVFANTIKASFKSMFVQLLNKNYADLNSSDVTRIERCNDPILSEFSQVLKVGGSYTPSIPVATSLSLHPGRYIPVATSRSLHPCRYIPVATSLSVIRFQFSETKDRKT